MPIFFSNGYVVNDSPKRAIVCVGGIYVSQVDVKAYWPREVGIC